MPLLVGRHVNKIDRKGRVSVPKPFRDALHDGGGGTGIIYVYPSFKAPAIEGCGEEFMSLIAESLNDMDLYSDDQDDLASVVMHSAHTLPLDPEGRVVLPAELLKHAGISGEALFVGGGERFQVWDPETHRQHLGRAFERARSRNATLRLRRDRGGGHDR